MADKDDLMELPSPFINYFGRDVFLVWGPSMSSLCPRSEVSISVASRLPRVSSRLALITHQVAVRRYPRGLGLEELPRLRVPSKLFLIRALQFARASLVRILHGLLLVTSCECLESRGHHATKPLQLADAFDIHRAPNTLRFSWGEAVGVTDIVHGLFYSVDPTETECFIHGFWIADTVFARLFLVEPNPKFLNFVVIRRQPISKNRR